MDFSSIQTVWLKNKQQNKNHKHLTTVLENLFKWTYRSATSQKVLKKKKKEKQNKTKIKYWWTRFLLLHNLQNMPNDKSKQNKVTDLSVPYITPHNNKTLVQSYLSPWKELLHDLITEEIIQICTRMYKINFRCFRMDNMYRPFSNCYIYSEETSGKSQNYVMLCKYICKVGSPWTVHSNF